MFKVIPGFTRYRINEKGEVCSEATKRILKNCKARNGYYVVNLRTDDSRKTVQRYIHRLVAEAFIPNPDNKPEINHIDGNKLNNSLRNLEWNTAKENQNHAWKTGLRKMPKGKNHYCYGQTRKEIFGW
jgi:hypothetical protein